MKGMLSAFGTVSHWADFKRSKKKNGSYHDYLHFFLRFFIRVFFFSTQLTDISIGARAQMFPIICILKTKDISLCW